MRRAAGIAAAVLGLAGCGAVEEDDG